MTNTGYNKPQRYYRCETWVGSMYYKHNIYTEDIYGFILSNEDTIATSGVTKLTHKGNFSRVYKNELKDLGTK